MNTISNAHAESGAATPAGDGSADAIHPAAVHAQLQRILASDGFAQSNRMKRFLQFVVAHQLGGSPGALKEFAIGVQVFDKDESFDPRVDPIVRVQAGRLRGKLIEYYSGLGAGDPIRIELPKRGYVPQFKRAEGVAGLGGTQDSAETATTDTLAAHEQAQNKRRWPRGGAGVALALFLLIAFASLYWIVGPAVLRDLGDADSGTSLVSVAVLPLKSLSPTEEDDYFGDAMTDAVITQLAQLQPLQVIATTSVLRFKGSTKTVPDIARELGVTHVLEGSVLRTNGRVRVTVQLVEAKQNRPVWAEQYARDVTDVLALQQEVADQISRALTGKLLRTQRRDSESIGLDTVAFDSYARGRYFRNQITQAGFGRAIDYFRSVIDRQPAFAPAYAGMASCYCLLGGLGFELLPPSEGMAIARTAAMRALELDSALAEPHAVLGIIYTKYDWDWERAEQAFEHALTLEPSYAQGRVWYSLYLEAMRRHGEAVAQAQAAQGLDPLSFSTNVNLAWQLLQAGREDDAGAQLARTLDLDATFWGVHWVYGHYYLRKQIHDKAIISLQRAVELQGGHSLAQSSLGYAYAISGRHRDARKMAEKLEAMSRTAYVSPAHIAAIYAGLGDRDEAFAWLEQAYRVRSRSMAWLDTAREWDQLRTDPRFAALREKVGLSG